VTGTLTDADATFAVTLAESNDPAMAGSNAVAAGELLGTLALASFTFADDVKCKKLGYNGIRRYVQATITPTGNTQAICLLAALGFWAIRLAHLRSTLLSRQKFRGRINAGA
jgi:hypothetical protein